jgi:hypothetical protein
MVLCPSIRTRIAIKINLGFMDNFKFDFKTKSGDIEATKIKDSPNLQQGAKKNQNTTPINDVIITAFAYKSIFIFLNNCPIKTITGKNRLSTTNSLINKSDLRHHIGNQSVKVMFAASV